MCSFSPQSQRGGRPEVMGTEAKYRYRKGATPTSRSPNILGNANGPVPEINILPATTIDGNTVPTTTIIDMHDVTNNYKPNNNNNKDDDDVMNKPRMYSASTDTDAYVFPVPPHPSEVSHYQGNITSRGHLPPNQPHAPALISLISSSYMTGAQAPILKKMNNDPCQPNQTKNPTPNENQNHCQNLEDVDKDDTTLMTDSTALAVTSVSANLRHRRINDKSGVVDSTGGDNDRWGHKTNSSVHQSASRPGGRDEGHVQELKVMTSTNTPDLNRVSVQSFRSIPLISDRSEILPEHVCYI